MNYYNEINGDSVTKFIIQSLCSSKDKDIVEYSLDSNMTQTKIEEYILILIDNKMLENKIREVKILIDNNKKKLIPS